MNQSNMLMRAALKSSTAAAAMTLALLSTPSLAQEAAAAGEAASETIVITGSRIARRDVESVAPVTVVDAAEFQLSGAVNVEQVINQLPQVIPGTTAFSNNPGGGVATLNLRGLGEQRTMVLVNGRRYMFYGTDQVVDLNTIPAFLLSGVDVVTGGGSAVYGSDALAGVVNFRLRNDLDGLIAGAQYSITGQGDGPRFNAHVALGTNFADNRGNVTIFAEYNKRGGIFQSERGFSRNALGDGANGLIPLGSAGVPQGRFVQSPTLGFDLDRNPATPNTVLPIAAGTNYVGAGAFFAQPGVSRPYVGATDSYNYAPVNYLMVPQERFLLGGYGEYEISEGLTAYAEVTFVNNRVENELAPTPITQNVDYNLNAIRGFVSANDFAQLSQISANQLAAQAAVQASNAANPTLAPLALPFPAFTAGTGQFGALQPGFVRLQTNTRTTSIQSRNAADDRSAFRILTGVRGDINEKLSYDAFYMYARTRNSQIQSGNVSRSIFTRLAGNGTCNTFGADLLSENCVNSIAILAQNTVISELEVAQGTLTGELFQFASANDPVQFAFGTEWRRMGSEFIPDTALSSGDVVGFNAGQPTAGAYTATEVFGELSVPLIQDGFIHRLEVEGAARYSDYSLPEVGGVWAYSAGIRLAPVKDLTFRGQYQRAIRAPNVGELFGGQSVGFPQATDPCALATAASNTTIRDLCIATGVPAANVGQAFLQPNPQIQGQFGGNPNLSEETADTWTVGGVFQPSFAPGMTFQVDYYDIQIDRAISVAGGGVNNILNLCYNVIQDAGSALCGLINRDPQGIISGEPFVVSATNANLASLSTKGIDFRFDYSTPLNFGLLDSGGSRLAFFFLATYTMENTFIPLVDLPDDRVECAGRFGLNCGEPTPEWKWSSRLSWIDGPLTSSIRWRYIGPTTDDDDDTDFIVERIGPYHVFDLAFSADVDERLTLNLGINNLFNRQPPIIGSNAEQANTYPDTFDVLGRDFFISAQFRF